MRRAFFVIGPESSGTRMMTKALISAGVWGDGEHYQILDNLNFHNRPDVIVFRRSIPHDDKWPALNGLYKLMVAAGYEVVPIVMWRRDEYMIKSQMVRRHVETEARARAQITRAYKLIGEFVHDKENELVQYEEFVTDAELRSEMFWDYGLTKPTIEFYNANEAYR